MNDNTISQQADSVNPRRREKEPNLSPDGKWKSFPKVPNLLQYVPSGVYFGRTKVNSKTTRHSLETTVFTTAKLRLADFLKDHGKPGLRGPSVLDTFKDARLRSSRSLSIATIWRMRSKLYRRNTIVALLRTWPDLDDAKLPRLTKGDCQEWARRFIDEGYDDQLFNNTLGTLRWILETGGLVAADNPARLIKRLAVQRRMLQLPEPEQFEPLLNKIETAGARQSKDCANFVRFLAYSGCRLSEARQMTWDRVDWKREVLRVPNAKTRHAGSAQSTETERTVPIISEMATLLRDLDSIPHGPTDPICGVGECEKSLSRACRLLKISRITHHDLRHLFATRCIESGVDIPTVSRWLGHKDGGALAMKVYGHLRHHHSAEMAKKVTFGTAPAAEGSNQQPAPTPQANRANPAAPQST